MTTKILIIDDDRIIRMMASAMLTRKGYQVLAAESIQQAWEMISSSGKPNLIFCDLMMPSLSGLDFLKSSKRSEILNDVPVIVITAASDKDLLEAACNAGAKQCIPKPFTQSQLDSAIQETLNIPAAA